MQFTLFLRIMVSLVSVNHENGWNIGRQYENLFFTDLRRIFSTFYHFDRWLTTLDADL